VVEYSNLFLELLDFINLELLEHFLIGKTSVKVLILFEQILLFLL